MRAHDQQRAFRIITTAAATARNIRLIVETIIASHTSIAYRVEHIAEGTPPHQGFSALISVEFACEVQRITLERVVLDKMFGGITFHLELKVYASVQNPDFFAAK